MKFNVGDIVRTNTDWNPDNSSLGEVTKVVNNGRRIEVFWKDGMFCTGATDLLFNRQSSLNFGFAVESAETYLDVVSTKSPFKTGDKVEYFQKTRGHVAFEFGTVGTVVNTGGWDGAGDGDGRTLVEGPYGKRTICQSIPHEDLRLFVEPEPDETEGKKVVNIANLRDYAVRGNVERDRVYLYVYAGLGGVSVIKALTPLVLRSPAQTYGFGDTTQKWKFRTESPGFFKDKMVSHWHHATDAGVILDKRVNGNFMLDPADLFAEGIVAEAGGVNYTPSEVANALSV